MHGQPTEQAGQQQRELRRHPSVLLPRFLIRKQCTCTNHQRSDGYHQGTAEHDTDGTEQGNYREGANSGGSAVRASVLSLLAFGTYQQANAQSHAKTQQGGLIKRIRNF